jgi:hypothetical protein
MGRRRSTAALKYNYKINGDVDLLSLTTPNALKAGGLKERVMRRAGWRDNRRGAADRTLKLPAGVFFDEGMHFAHPAIDRN